MGEKMQNVLQIMTGEFEAFRVSLGYASDFKGDMVNGRRTSER